MNIAVLLKQVQKENDIHLKADLSIDRTRGKQEMNLADKSALFEAASLKRETGGQIVCISMGPQSARAVLQEGAVHGGTRLVHICDPVFGGSDTLATSRVLARAIEWVGRPELVLCGRRTTDGETGQVGPQVAQHLGYECVSSVIAIEGVTGGRIHVRRLLEDRIHRLSVPLPAVLCICENNFQSALPSLRQVRAAASVAVETITNRELSLPDVLCGKTGSPTQVKAIHTRAMGCRTAQFVTTPKELAQQLSSCLSGRWEADE